MEVNMLTRRRRGTRWREVCRVRQEGLEKEIQGRIGGP